MGIFNTIKAYLFEMAAALSFLPLEKKHIADFITETST